MGTEISAKPSFSRRRKWGIGFNVTLSILVTLAVIVMVNYLSGRYFKRVYFSTNTKVELSPQTIGLLRSITNHIQVTVYYDKEEDLYGDIVDLLKAYRSTNPRIVVSFIDYYRNPGAAVELKAKYNFGSSTNRNFVIFDCEGRIKVVDGQALGDYKYDFTHSDENPQAKFSRNLIGFRGEMLFSGALLAITSLKAPKAYILQGHDEHSISDDSSTGYKTFALVLNQNYIDARPLTLLGTNDIPIDCNLLVIPGPAANIPEFELTKIEQYLNQGGRLLALFNIRSAAQDIGLEKILAKWGVKVLPDLAVDPEHMTPGGKELIVSAFSLHPSLSPIVGSGLYMVVPRPIVKAAGTNQPIEGITVEEIAFTGEKGYLYTDKQQHTGRVPVIVAVDQTAKGPIKERGTSRMMIAGDSFLLDNDQIEQLSDRSFASAAVNWLLDRNFLLKGVGPRSVSEYRILVSRAQMQTLQWTLLGAIPGGILLFGVVVWLSRRK